MVQRTANPKLAAKLYPNKERKKIDTVRNNDIFGRNDDVMMDAYTAWAGLESFRDMAERNKVYTFVDQWSDKVKTKCGWITERQNILNQGNIPLQNNRIRGIVRSVSGVMRSQPTEPVCWARDRDSQKKGEIMSATIQYVSQLNELNELNNSVFLDYLVTGIGGFKNTYGWRNGRMNVWIDKINFNRIFFDNHIQDPRHWDCHLVGEIHDVGLYDVMAQFADGSPEKAERIREIYRECDRGRTVIYAQNLTKCNRRQLSFFTPSDETRCRVIEVWKKESKERFLCHDTLNGDFYKVEIEDELQLIRLNENRIQEQTAQGVAPEDMRLIDYVWFIDNYWYYYYLTPQGDVLKEGETPFWHGEHPYSLKVYPFFDGQVFPFVSDFIDQQRYINRLITMQDFVTRASAKGVLAIDKDAIPEGWTEKMYADEWASYNGVILYTSKKGKLPEQIVNNSTNVGLIDMLQIQLKLLEDISGVQGALQGQAPKAGTPAALYQMQIQNSSTSLTELFESFSSLKKGMYTKTMKLIQQYYDEPIYVRINGNNLSENAILYDPSVVRDAEMELSIAESSSTPTFRFMINEMLMQLWSAGAIDVEQLLENGNFPFADKLLQSIRTKKQEIEQAQLAMAQGQQGVQPGLQNGIPQDVLQAVQSQSNPVITQMLNKNIA
ncbi:hypothetical protein [Dysgonomonas sp. 511]|uniref:portal protein n=1 Tax=Dysgonomonas sp. 511 TaxID=2302930 RepID=UPI0013D2CD55|nr:hypothetical protein [Dysgonomonas sp. 511]NDV77852.1 hypothetical protein [Dysgonomonas sp. 511]